MMPMLKDGDKSEGLKRGPSLCSFEEETKLSQSAEPDGDDGDAGLIVTRPAATEHEI